MFLPRLIGQRPHHLLDVIWDLGGELGERVRSIGIVRVGAEKDNPPVRSYGAEELEDEQVVRQMSDLEGCLEAVLRVLCLR